MFKRIKRWLGIVSCFLHFHDEEFVDHDKDPFRGVARGHSCTTECLRCGKYRRVVGYKYLMPWMDGPLPRKGT